MQNEWQKFLEQQGAVIENDRVLHFGSPEREPEAAATDHVLADLSHYGLIAARGEEAMDFLQNQFSNDIRQVTDTESQLSAYCSPKGRMLAEFRIFRFRDVYYLRLPRELLEPTLKRLRMFILRSKVTLEDASDTLVRFGFAGPEADKRLGEILKAVPTEANRVGQNDGLVIIRLPGPLPRFEIHGEPDAGQALWRRLARQATPVGAGRWNWLDIQAGLPEILPPTVEAFVPQMVNLEALQGISFKKGCYPGQEVVARMHYLGKLKRRMYRAHLAEPEIPAAGENVYVAGEEQSAGKVVRAEAAPGGGVDLLAVIQIASAGQGNLRLGRPDGPALELRDLPYTVTDPA
jgi:folate-binding protein YgfZ